MMRAARFEAVQPPAQVPSSGIEGAMNVAAVMMMVLHAGQGGARRSGKRRAVERCTSA